jgi:hypothetical protein
MFRLSIFILDLSLSPLASLSSPLPSDINSHHPFRPRTCCCTSISHSIAAFTLNARLLSHTMPCALSPVGHSLSTLFPFSPPSLSLGIAYNVSLWTQTWHINTKSPALLKSRQLRHNLSPFRLCAFLGNCGPFSLSFRPCLYILVLLIRPI